MTVRTHTALDREQEQALALLLGAQRFVLVGHMKPDGDVIGSQAAMCRVLQALKKDVWIVNPDPPEGRYEYLAREVRFGTYTTGDLPPHDVAVLLDFSERSRTGDMEAALVRAPSKKVVVDHHIHHGEVWWDARFVDVKAAATGLLVARIAKALGVPLDATAARGVFTSLVTDTGWFKYSNTDAETLRVAGELIESGVVPSELYAAIYQSKSHQHPAYVGRLLSGLAYFADNRLAVIQQTLRDATDPNLVDSDEVLDILRSVKVVEVVLFMRELEKGGVKVSARSKSDFDVNALMRQFGGGGHKKASGATVEGQLADVRERVVAAALARFAKEPEGSPDRR
ncbi:MAG: bifunctional oligoribonuclease/PAP phosphatase NrnA [Planctomycetes bacterium]|nr:bifunctional oligoribonuclease/PAP phosphatase NrnA [Planctomycetota bacterium]